MQPWNYVTYLSWDIYWILELRGTPYWLVNTYAYLRSTGENKYKSINLFASGTSQPLAEVLLRICMCKSHQSVAELLGRSSHCLDKTLTQQL